MRSILLSPMLLLALAATAAAQNSTARIRPEPSPLAARAGMAVDWRADLESALAESQRSGKPVFWYVPTVSGSFMDRWDRLDRHMLAGPFSWPRTVALLNERFVPVRMKASRKLRSAHGLEPIAFIEPGWLVLDGEGRELGREHQISTFHPARFLAPLAALAEVENPALDRLPGDVDDPAVAQWLEGVEHWRGKREAEAREVWRSLGAEHPEHPMAAKAAMEAQGIGPFVHAFETYDELPAAAFVPHPAGTQAPREVYGEEALRARSVAFLLDQQRSSGGWEASAYDFGGTDGLPNVFVAVSAICTLGLLEHAARLSEPDEALEGALERALAYVSDETHINRQDSDEILWAHTYRIRCFARWIELRPKDAPRVRPLLEAAVADLIAIQSPQGAWGHEYPSPFAVAEALIALGEARRVGVASDDLEQAVARGVGRLIACRTAEGAYTYGLVYRGRPRARAEGSVGRTPRGELALTHWAPEKSIGLTKALALSFEHEHHLLPIRKYDDHTRNFGYGGFFFSWDLHARTEAIAALPAGDARSSAARRQREQLLALPEFDGAFAESHETGRCYATGMALWCLGILDGVAD